MYQIKFIFTPYNQNFELDPLDYLNTILSKSSSF